MIESHSPFDDAHSTMADARARDPYYVVRDDINRAITDARARVTSGATTTTTSVLKEDAEALEWEIDELARSIDTAERDRTRFKLDDEEIRARRRWVEQSRGKVRELMEVLVARARRESNAAALAATSASAMATRGHDGHAASEAGFDDHQQLLVRGQDHDLDDISESITRIGQVGLTIGEELASQSRMLEELDDDVSGVNARLAAAQRKMETVLKQAGIRGQLCVILFLTVILVILFYVAVGNA